ncbi:MAG TPA: ATP-binding cassette domain-containing protein [Pyrinomonadaceae bacterium]|jgi:ABC-type Fe3+/spermidine/putrescine transport system ATPase subunit
MPLEIKGLSKRYGNKWILRDVEFTASEGRVLGLLSGTASGKTTLLDILTGNTRSNGGSVVLNGSDMLAVRPKERDITLLPEPQKPPVISLLASRSQESSGETLVRGFEEKLSKAGKLVLLDDPFAHLDLELRGRCLEQVRRAARQRERIVILATTDFEQITEVADDVSVLANDHVVQSGTPQEVYDEPNSVAVANLTGGGNLFEARRLSKNDAELPEFHTIDGGHRIFAAPTEKSRLGSIHQNVTLCIRPEQIAMSIGSSFPEDNLLRAVVTGIHFRGATSIVEFDASGLRLETRTFKVVGLNIGDECMLGLPPHRIRILRY